MSFLKAVIQRNRDGKEGFKETEEAIKERRRAIKIRSQCRQFRILVIGKANAGKTTILQKICNTAERPLVYDRKGQKIDPSILDATMGRGSHEINNELIFASNPSFIFHDSPGFEAASVDELKIVRKFISERAKCSNLADQLHAIWYCIPTDNCRPFQPTEKLFFSECGTGKVPVIAIFTKFDALRVKAFAALCHEGQGWEEAREGAPARALADLEKIYLEPLSRMKYLPAQQLHLGDMHKPGVNCPELIDKTAAALSDDALKLLFLSVQQINLDTCIIDAVQR